METAAYSALHSLLTAVGKTAGAKEVCVITPPGGSERIVLASSIYDEPVLDRVYKEGVRGIFTDALYEGQLLGNLVVVDPAQLDAFALAAGYIMGYSRSLKEVTTVPANRLAQAIQRAETARNLRWLLGSNDPAATSAGETV